MSRQATIARQSSPAKSSPWRAMSRRSVTRIPPRPTGKSRDLWAWTFGPSARTRASGVFTRSLSAARMRWATVPREWGRYSFRRVRSVRVRASSKAASSAPMTGPSQRSDWEGPVPFAPLPHMSSNPFTIFDFLFTSVFPIEGTTSGRVARRVPLGVMLLLLLICAPLPADSTEAFNRIIPGWTSIQTACSAPPGWPWSIMPTTWSRTVEISPWARTTSMSARTIWWFVRMARRRAAWSWPRKAGTEIFGAWTCRRVRWKTLPRWLPWGGPGYRWSGRLGNYRDHRCLGVLWAGQLVVQCSGPSTGAGSAAKHGGGRTTPPHAPQSLRNWLAHQSRQAPARPAFSLYRSSNQWLRQHYVRIATCRQRLAFASSVAWRESSNQPGLLPIRLVWCSRSACVALPNQPPEWPS